MLPILPGYGPSPYNKTMLPIIPDYAKVLARTPLSGSQLDTMRVPGQPYTTSSGGVAQQGMQDAGGSIGGGREWGQKPQAPAAQPRPQQPAAGQGMPTPRGANVGAGPTANFGVMDYNRSVMGGGGGGGSAMGGMVDAVSSMMANAGGKSQETLAGMSGPVGVSNESGGSTLGSGGGGGGGVFIQRQPTGGGIMSPFNPQRSGGTEVGYGGVSGQGLSGNELYGGTGAQEESGSGGGGAAPAGGNESPVGPAPEPPAPDGGEGGEGPGADGGFGGMTGSGDEEDENSPCYGEGAGSAACEMHRYLLERSKAYRNMWGGGGGGE